MSARVLISLLIVGTGCKGKPTGGERAPVPRTLPPDASARPDADQLDVEIAPGLSVRKLRRATEEMAERARRSRNKNTVSLPVCIGLESAGIVVRCTDVGSLGYGPIDRASFELPDPTDGRGVIFHYGSAADFDEALRAFETFERDYGTFVIANAPALVIFSGAEQLSDDAKQIVRRYIGSLPL